MRLRRRITQRLPAWLAFLAIGLAAFAPTVSQCVLARHAAMGLQAPASGHGALAGMAPDCPGHMAPPAASSPDHAMHHGRGGAPMEACGYCGLMAHPPVLGSVPALLMRPPAAMADAHPPTLPGRTPAAPWLFDGAPRGPPLLT